MPRSRSPPAPTAYARLQPHLPTAELQERQAARHHPRDHGETVVAVPSTRITPDEPLIQPAYDRLTPPRSRHGE